MSKIKIITTLIMILFPIIAKSQISTEEKPISFSLNIGILEIPTIVMPFINIDSVVQYEAELDAQGIGRPFRFGYAIDVNINLKEAGIQHQLPNGDKLYLLKIHSSNAYSINLIYNNFRLSIGSKFFIYNESRTMTLGAFTPELCNNSKNVFATDLVQGSTIILEYYEPEYSNNGIINISKAIHGYINTFSNSFNNKIVDNFLSDGYGQSDTCNIDVNCPLGDNWDNEKRAVALILNNSWLCSGSLINNVRQDCTPYLLTAGHCDNLSGGIPFDVWIFRFKYWRPACDSGDPDPNTWKSIAGATMRMKIGLLPTDCMLLELNTRPPGHYNVYYAGWDRRFISPQNATGIHHPKGDVMKISYDADSILVYTNNNNNWKVVFDQGTAEGGSSGSPLFNQDHRIVGQLFGGTPDNHICDNPSVSYGRFDLSWEGLGTPSTRLKDWLDPDNTGIEVLDGINLGDPEYISLLIWGDPNISMIPYYDTFYMLRCCGNIPIAPQDTIYYKENGIEKCLGKNFNTYRINLPNTTKDKNNIIWYINGDSVAKGLEPTGPYFRLSLYANLWKNPNYDDEYIIVEARFPDGSKYIFKFRVYNHENIVSQMPSYWKSMNVGFDYEIEENTVIIRHCLKEKALTIPLPNLGCTRETINENISDDWIVFNSNSIVILPTDEPEVNIKIRYNCDDCSGILNFKVINEGCPEDTTEYVGGVMICDFVFYPIMGPLDGWLDTLPNIFPGIRNQFERFPTYYSPQGKIQGLHANVLTNNSDVEVVIHDEDFAYVDYDTGDSIYTRSVDFQFRCPPIPPTPYDSLTMDDYSFDVEICVETEAKLCCDTLKIWFPCYKFLEVGGVVNPGGCNSTIGVYYELYDIPPMPVPLHIAIYDKFGYKKKDVMSEVPTKISDTLTQDISMLPPDDYQMVFFIGSQLEIVPFTIECKVVSATVTPNPGDMPTISIGYKLAELTGDALKIDIYDAMGNFVQNVMDAVPSSTEDSISVSTNNLTTGQYNVVFQYGDFVTSVSFIKQ